MEHLVAILVPIACGCILPIFAIWMGIRKEMNETNTRTQIALAAIEKNPDLDIEELMKKISPKKKLLKEKLLGKLQTGNITTFLGIGFLICAIYVDFLGGMNSNDLRMLYLAGAILLGVGIAFLINYSKGKKMLAKEMEAVEYLKKHQEATIRRYKMLMVAAFVVGIICGAVSITYVLTTPADVPLFTFQVQTGFLLWLAENSRLIAATGLSLLMMMGIISIISNIQDILHMRVSLKASA